MVMRHTQNQEVFDPNPDEILEQGTLNAYSSPGNKTTIQIDKHAVKFDHFFDEKFNRKQII